MSVGLLSLIVLAIAVAGYILGRRRAIAAAGGDARKLHSLPSYHGQSIFLFTAVPAFILMIFWLLAQPIYIENRITSLIPNVEAADAAARELAMADVRRVASGLDLAIAQGALLQSDLGNLQADATDLRGKLADVGVALGADVSQYTFEAAREYRSLKGTLGIGMAVAVLAAAAAGFAYAW